MNSWYVGVLGEKPENNIIIYNHRELPKALADDYSRILSSNGNVRYEIFASSLSDVVERLSALGAISNDVSRKIPPRDFTAMTMPDPGTLKYLLGSTEVSARP
jgi:hypothetical protein